MARAVRFGAGWHPLRLTVAGLRDDALPRLQAIAARLDRPVPALCPRIMLRLSDTPVTDEHRLAGVGTLDQVRRDLDGLAEIGCTHVLLDTYYDDMEATADYRAAWRMLTAMAEGAFDDWR